MRPQTTNNAHRAHRIHLRSGRYAHLFDLKPDQFSFDDLSYALAHINRFGGHVGAYSVLDHSVLVAHVLASPAIGRADLANEGLFHDFPEAIYGDVVAPLRRGLPDYREAYNRGEAVIFKALGLPSRLSAETRQADLIALAIEATHFYNIDPVADWDLPFGIPSNAPPIYKSESPAESMKRFRQVMSDFGIEEPTWRDGSSW